MNKHRTPTTTTILALALIGCGSEQPPAPTPPAVAASTVACPGAGTTAPPNLVPDGTFDRAPGAWSAGEVGDDAAGCATSHSLSLTATRVDDQSILFANSRSPCFKLSGAAPAYTFGAALKRHEGAAVGCFLLVWDTPTACEQSDAGEKRLESIDNGLVDVDQWGHSAIKLPAPAADAWARVNCRTDGQGYVDEVFVTSAP
jgi:hypothetical protein